MYQLIRGVQMATEYVRGNTAGMLDVDDLVEMVVLDVVVLESTGESNVELSVDGDVVGDAAARGYYGWFWIPGLE